MNAPRRPPRRRVDGVLLLDKPLGMTSNAALQAVRRLLNAEKAGHTGTLDPLATGLLPLCFGEATKFAGELLDADKTYDAVVRLGIRTDTGDAEGRVIETRPVVVSEHEADAALARFVGEITQIPPMHSALKRDGRPLYEYARQGLEVDRAPRRVTIHGIEKLCASREDLTLRVRCSKGTYIRTLAEDIGRFLGCGAHLAGLRRTGIGDLLIDDALTLADMESRTYDQRDAGLAPPDALLQGLPAIRLDEQEAGRILHGQAVESSDDTEGRVRIYCGNRFLGLGLADSDGLVRPRRLISSLR
ncbi:MAG: tRNA pseudouridine(55) synthase TruB [Rhodocyclaceae bacterium]|nr:tRNA pseudouridine(55) synthase TruB [Rhodocyclaceae bacterium]